MRIQALLCSVSFLLAASVSSAAPPAPAPKPIPGAPFFETETFVLDANVPVEVVPARASRRLLVISALPSGGTRIEIGGPDLTCQFDNTSWIAIIVATAAVERVELPTSASVWACSGNGANWLSYIEFYD